MEIEHWGKIIPLSQKVVFYLQFVQTEVKRASQKKIDQNNFKVPYQELSVEPSSVANGVTILAICQDELKPDFAFCQRLRRP